MFEPVVCTLIIFIESKGDCTAARGIIKNKSEHHDWHSAKKASLQHTEIS
jgi:hypothetical protein